MKKLVLFVLAVMFAWSTTYALPALGKAMQPTTQATKPVLPDVQTITFSHSAVLLEKGWMFHPGDSPWVNGAPLWAQPRYSDAGWAAMNMVPKAGSVDLMTGTSGFIPGWTSRGYPHLTGYAWYRLRVRVADQNQRLWLKMPINFDNVFQLYANGRYVGEFGDFTSRHVTEYYSQPTAFALPKAGPDGILTLALRFHMSPATALTNPEVGGMHGPPALGLASTVQLMQQSTWNSQLRIFFSDFVMLFLSMLVAPLALWAWLSNRREHMWLWLFLALAWDFVLRISLTLSSLTTVLDIASDQMLEAISLPMFALLVMFWWHWFGLESKRWFPRMAWGLAAASAVAGLLAASPFLGWQILPPAALPWCHDLSLGLGAGIPVLQIVILVEGFRRDRLEALLPAIPILLMVFESLSTYFLVAFHIPTAIFPFGFGIRVDDVVEFLMIIVIALLSLRRFMKTRVQESLEREAISRDLEDAKELQQRVLVPETIDSRNFTVEAAYHPAQKVGGDFFQTVTRPDGTLLVVIGDVSGKGVSAAMLVAVLVGTIRNQAEHSFDPQEMLTVLNRRMMGRSGGHFATCLAAEIVPDGTMRIANAGHLSPYLNGAEMELEGSLPLGLSPDAEYGVQTVKLDSGDRLTFITDGVVEAQNEAKELFGFERARAVSGDKAAAIAEAASSFGQEDDITVVGVAFAAV